jgi:hypothetical protein
MTSFSLADAFVAGYEYSKIKKNGEKNPQD